GKLFGSCPRKRPNSYPSTRMSMSTKSRQSQIVGKVLNFGSEFFFVRWMSLSGDVTYQVSIVSEKPVDLERGVFHDFIGSLTLQKKETNQAAQTTPGAVPNLKH
ncbi:MAG: hypothetical protein Q8N18_05005, partial [Opitutaceae bacterium]|nr:hypothetical protein [Opitutaceae bacterium]